MFGFERNTRTVVCNCVHWHAHVLWIEDGYVLGRALEFVVEGQWKKRGPKKTWE